MTDVLPIPAIVRASGYVLCKFEAALQNIAKRHFKGLNASVVFWGWDQWRLSIGDLGLCYEITLVNDTEFAIQGADLSQQSFRLPHCRYSFFTCIRVALEPKKKKKPGMEAENERLRMELVESRQLVASLRLERDELLNRWNEFATYRNEPLVKELEAARRMVDNQRQWMRCFLDKCGEPGV